ncbi:MAG TPA: hypothetical protein ENK34_11730 [Rhodobacteraceae bacterium]|nr:hypothetical protein [Paracoccaceae bacterium]
MLFAFTNTHKKFKCCISAILLFCCSLTAAADTDNSRNEEIIASTIQSYSRVPDITTVTVQQCNIEIVVRHSEFHHCTQLDSADLSRTLLSLREIDEIRIGNGGSGRVAIYFNFVPSVTRKLEKAKEIWRSDQAFDQPITTHNLDKEASSRAFEYLYNSNVLFRSEVVDCGNVHHIEIVSPLSYFLVLRKGVPNSFFYALQEYYSMCKPLIN